MNTLKVTQLFYPIITRAPPRNFYSTHETQSNLRLPSFSHFNLHEGIFKYLESSNIHTPTFIQYAYLSSLKENYNQIHHITSPTGSGKTLAYMLPIINHLKQE